MKKKINLRDQFKKIKLLVLDVDGVLTQGEIVYDDRGVESKTFNVKDGFGVFLLSRLGIKTVLLSARNSRVLRKRAKDMRVAEVIGGFLPKEDALLGIKQRYKVSAGEICFIGDDLIDLEVIKRVGLGVAVADAVPKVRQAAKYTTLKKGGQGAVREIIDLIIKHKGLDKKIPAVLKSLN